MTVIEMYADDNILKSVVYDLVNNNIRKKNTLSTLDILKLFEGNARLIKDVRPLNNDMNFQYSDKIVIIRNYNFLKCVACLQNLRQILNQTYRKEKLRKKRILQIGSSMTITTMAALVLLSLSANNKAKDTYVQLPTPYSTTIDYNANDFVSDDPVYEEEILTLKQEQNEVMVEPIEDNSPLDLTDSVTIFYEERSNSQKIIDTRNNYGDVITKYSNMYGLDPNLMIAVATQEKGFHSSQIDPGGAIGIMQIQYDFWVGKKLDVYNYQTNSVETIHVDENNIKDLETNIRLGCAIMRANLNMMKNNQIAALQSYNYGSGNTFKVLDAYAYDNGITRDDVLANHCDVGWITAHDNFYRNMISVGDKNYVEHVLSYLGDDVFLSCASDNGSININIKNNNLMVRS